MTDNSDSGNKPPSDEDDRELYDAVLKLGSKAGAESKTEWERDQAKTRSDKIITLAVGTFIIAVAAIFVAVVIPWLIHLDSQVDHFHREFRDIRDHVGTIQADIRVHEESHKSAEAHKDEESHKKQ